MVWQSGKVCVCKVPKQSGDRSIRDPLGGHCPVPGDQIEMGGVSKPARDRRRQTRNGGR